MRRRSMLVGAALIVGGLLFASFGFTASLGTKTKTLGANKTTVPRCDADGVTVIQNLSGSPFNVVSVTVGSIASACATATLSVTVNNGTTSSTGTGTVPAGGGSMTVTLASAIAVKESEETDVAISGP